MIGVGGEDGAGTGMYLHLPTQQGRRCNAFGDDVKIVDKVMRLSNRIDV